MSNLQPKTLFEKVWEAHEVVPETPERPAILYIDLHLIHEVTSAAGFEMLRHRRLAVHRPVATVATMDHATPTLADTRGRLLFHDGLAEGLVQKLEANCRAHGILLHGLDSELRGIVHVIAPELGLTRPGMTIVCGDSHTSTHGAFGALAFGIGSTEVGHVLATQCLLQRRPKTFSIRVEGRLPHGVTAKDLILAIIANIGVNGGKEHVLEFRGPGIRILSMEERMTLCNMSIEAGARAGMIAPDEVTEAYLSTRMTGPSLERSLPWWKELVTDIDARFDREYVIDASRLEPWITYGTNPGLAIPITQPIPAAAPERALQYMGLRAGQSILGLPIDVVFLGSCTNARLSDLRSAASLFKGRRVSPRVHMIVVPGSQSVRRQAEAEGLHEVFQSAGADWRLSGCSMCIAMNGDMLRPGQYAVSTSNRNFEGRQGPGGRTLLASPLTAAASAVAGAVADPRQYLD